MIKLNKFDNKDLMYCCNSCHTIKEKTMYELLIGYGNGGMLMYLCPECARDLKQKTDTFITTDKNKAKALDILKEYFDIQIIETASDDTAAIVISRKDSNGALHFAQKLIKDKEKINLLKEVLENE